MNLIPRIDKMIYCMSHEYAGCTDGDWDEEITLLMNCRKMLLKLFMLPVEKDDES